MKKKIYERIILIALLVSSIIMLCLTSVSTLFRTIGFGLLSCCCVFLSYILIRDYKVSKPRKKKLKHKKSADELLAEQSLKQESTYEMQEEAKLEELTKEERKMEKKQNAFWRNKLLNIVLVVSITLVVVSIFLESIT